MTRSRLRGQSGLALENLTLDHFSFSSAMSWPKSVGEPGSIKGRLGAIPHGEFARDFVPYGRDRTALHWGGG